LNFVFVYEGTVSWGLEKTDEKQGYPLKECSFSIFKD